MHARTRPGLWYQELTFGHAASAWRCVAANLLETSYVALSCGLGALVSLTLRCGSARRQTAGEMVAGVAAVQEWQRRRRRGGGG